MNRTRSIAKKLIEWTSLVMRALPVPCGRGLPYKGQTVPKPTELPPPPSGKSGEYRPGTAVPPWETFAEMVSWNLATDWLDMSRDKIKAFKTGDLRIDAEFAAKLEEWVGLPASSWMNLDANYVKHRERLETTLGEKCEDRLKRFSEELEQVPQIFKRDVMEAIERVRRENGFGMEPTGIRLSREEETRAKQEFGMYGSPDKIVELYGLKVEYVSTEEARSTPLKERIVWESSSIMSFVPQPVDDERFEACIEQAFLQYDELYARLAAPSGDASEAAAYIMQRRQAAGIPADMFDPFECYSNYGSVKTDIDSGEGRLGLREWCGKCNCESYDIERITDGVFWCDECRDVYVSDGDFSRRAMVVLLDGEIDYSRLKNKAGFARAKEAIRIHFPELSECKIFSLGGGTYIAGIGCGIGVVHPRFDPIPVPEDEIELLCDLPEYSSKNRWLLDE